MSDEHELLLAGYVLQCFERIEALERRLDLRVQNENLALAHETAPYAEDYDTARDRATKARRSAPKPTRIEDELIPPKARLRDRDPVVAERWRRIKLA